MRYSLFLGGNLMPDLIAVAAALKTVGGSGAAYVNGFQVSDSGVSSVSGTIDTVAGNTVIVAVALARSAGAPGITDTFGNYYFLLGSQPTLFVTVYLYVCLGTSGTGPNTISVYTLSGIQDWDVTCTQYSNIVTNPLDAEDGSASNAALGGTVVALPTITTTVAGDLIVCTCYDDLESGDVFSISPGSWNNREQTANPNGSCIALLDILSVAQGSYQYTASFPFPLTLSTFLPSGYVGSQYSGYLNATGGTPPYTFSWIGGSLPPGLSVDSYAGLIVGTPTATGTYNFEVEVEDSVGAIATAEVTISIGVLSIVVQCNNPPAGAVGTPYSHTFTATNGSPPYVFSITAGSLPAGLTLSPGGLVSGIPTASGTVSFNVTVTDSANSVGVVTCAIIVTAAIPLSMSGTPPNGTVGYSYNFSFSATGGMAPYVFSVSLGTVPAGLSLSASGVLSGVPTTAGSFSFTVKVTDSASNTASIPCTVLITSPTGGTVTVFCNDPPSGIVGMPYTHNFLETGAVSPVWSISGGALPPGLTLNSMTGQVSGTPTTPGTYTFEVSVS